MSWAHPHAPVQGATDEWWTPPEVFEALGLKFALDPCAPPGGVPWVPANYHYTRDEDGLNRDWFGRVWLNPPYGREAGAWVNRLAEHGDGIALVFSRTDVRWWHEAVPKATAVCFVRGRLTFVAGAGQSAPGNSGGPSALIAYGMDCARAVQHSGLGLTYFTPGLPDGLSERVARDWERDHDELQARLDRAEAVIARVREWAEKPHLPGFDAAAAQVLSLLDSNPDGEAR